MEFIEKTLEKYGLNEKEIKIYLACLKHEVTSPNELSKATGIPRTTIYDILLNLSLKRLVELEQSDGFTKQQTKVRAKNPSILREILQKKRKDLTRLELDIIDILPQLKDHFQKKKSNANFKFYPGIDGLKKVYADELLNSVDVERYAWDVLMPMDVVGHELMNKISDMQNEQYGESRLYKPKELIALNDWTKHVISYQYGRNPEYIKVRDIRYIENPIFDIKVELQIIGDIVRIANASEDEIWGMTMNSKGLSSTLKSIFLTEWENAVPLTEDIVKSWGENEMIKYEDSKKN